ncbi:hypothetical protein C2G38_2027697 [Gigaspora rosea]|uniref:Galactose oxidase n=1 Tax=Gigaspora rosea TaxID=44941 RepID=A0A397W418_9GLOM|nr:hypothetical protein C2G38_2027697 [Gigaspora rosea]
MKISQFVLSFLSLISLCLFATCLNVPEVRMFQTSSLIGTKLYFFGGRSSLNYTNEIYLDLPNSLTSNYTNEVWYLDLTNSSIFDSAIPTWHQDVGMPVGYALGTSCVSPTDNAIFIIGGKQYLPNSYNISFNSPVYKFDPNNNSLWTIPNITRFNDTFRTRNSMQAVIDNTGKIFIFGGVNFLSNDSDKSKITFYNDMNILDITTMSWSTLIIPQAPFYIYYTATLLPSGLIVYIGGIKNTIAKMSEAWFMLF